MIRAFAIVAFAVFAVADAGEPCNDVIPPKDGYVPDRGTAISIAVAVLTALNGAALVEREKPYTALLDGDTWVVSGAPPPEMGGVAVVQISKKDGRIKCVYHTL